MVATDTEQVEVNSPAMGNTRNNENGVHPSLGRQSSIYSLTLDEFQNTMCESGKNFGSMNMDEFLNSIWTAEENQNQVHHHHHNPQNDAISTVAHTVAIANPQSAPARGSGLARQPSLARQGSLTLPAPLCRKTVEEVWSEIQRGGHGGSRGNTENRQNRANGPTQRQQTFGEMTLEDFLIKAGVVRDSAPPAPPSAVITPQQPPPATPAQYGIYQNGNNPYVGPIGGGESSAAYLAGAVNNKRNNGYAPVGPATTMCYGGPGGGGPGYGTGLGMTSPVSPLGPEGMGDGTEGQYRMDAEGMRKRALDGPVEKVVERRQRRMIKNRESAARSRARKQAYTVELEAELNQLRDDNNHLKQALDELERQRNQQYTEEEPEQQNVAQSKAQKAEEKLRMLQRSKSCPL